MKTKGAFSVRKLVSLPHLRLDQAMMFPGFGPGLDPSKLDAKIIAEVSELMRSLPPALIMKMQTVMQQSMAGVDVTADMRELESQLPSGFREKMAQISYRVHGVNTQPVVQQKVAAMDSIEQARLTILRAVANQNLSPEEALKALFPS